MEYKLVGQLKVPQNLDPEKQKLVNEIAQNYLNELSDINAETTKGKTRGAIGSLISGASFHPFFNVPYVGTGIGGAMYDAGQGIVEGQKLPEIAKRAGRGFVIGETVGAVPYVGKLASKTKAGQAAGKALNEAAEKFAQTKAYDVLMSDIKALNPNKQIAYHGSPYDFEKFSNEAIGTGEGAQAHGFGHYAALNKDIGEGYRLRLTQELPKKAEITDADGNIINEDNFVADYLAEALTGTKGEKNAIYRAERKKQELLDSIDYINDRAKKDDNFAFEIRPYLQEQKEQLGKINSALMYLNDLDNLKVNILGNNNGQLYKLSIPKKSELWREGLEPHNQSKEVQKIYDNLYEQDKNKIIKDYDNKIKETKDYYNKVWDRYIKKLGSKSQYAKDLLDAELSKDENLINKAWDNYEKNIGYDSSIKFDPNKVYRIKRSIEDSLFDLENKKNQDIFWELGRKNYVDFNDPEIVKKWSNAGLKGISYNGGIDGEAAVIFNPDDISIVRKYYNQPDLKDLYNRFINSGAYGSALFSN